MDEKKYTVTTASDAILICPECGAKNETGAKNCTYCGRTLVVVTETDVEEKKIKYSKEFLKEDWAQTKKNLENLGKIRSGAGAEQKVNKSPQEQMDSKKKEKVIIVIVVVLALIAGGGFMLLFGLFNILPMVLEVVMNYIKPGFLQDISDMVQNNDSLVKVGIALFSMLIPVFGMVFFGIMILAAIIIALIVIPRVFKQSRESKSVLKMKCTNCGANNPAGSRVCAYCGNNLIDSTEYKSTLK